MSHEFLTPMNGIIGFVNLLQETELTATQQNYLGFVTNSSARLMQLVNQLLYFSEIEQSDKNLTISEFNIHQLIEEATHPYSTSANAKGLKMSLSVNEAVPKMLLGDRAVLFQVINNLIDNAVKYTEKGFVKILLQLDSEHTEGKVALHCSVKDTGRGIPPEKQKDIFQAFTQGGDFSTRSQEGAGLGLSICHKLVELMNGVIWVESKPNSGSTFHFSAPFGLPPRGNEKESVKEPKL